MRIHTIRSSVKESVHIMVALQRIGHRHLYVSALNEFIVTDYELGVLRAAGYNFMVVVN